MKYKISQHLLILYGLTEPSDLIGYSLYCNIAAFPMLVFTLKMNYNFLYVVRGGVLLNV